jgi:hypothetical protein
MAVEYRAKHTLAASVVASAVHNAPTGLSNDDILVCLLYKENTNALTVPSGFSSPVEISASDSSFRLYYTWKRAASESGTYTFSWTGNAYRVSNLLAISGAVTSGDPNDATATTAGNGAQNNKIDCPTITTATDGSLVIAFGSNYDYNMDAATVTAGYTIRERADVCAVADDVKDSAGATGTITFTHAKGSSQTAGITIALKPPAAAPTAKPAFLQYQ